VPLKHIEEALIIVENINAGKYEAELEQEEHQSIVTKCVKCGSTALQTVDWSWKISLLILFLYSVPIPYTQHLLKCEVCSYIWIATKHRGYPLYVPRFYILILIGIMVVGYEIWCHWCELHCEQVMCL
jgi:hypothetical protein